MMIAATLSGPNYWAANYDETTIEVFPSLAEAIEALFDRESANGRRHCSYTTLDGREHDVLFPGFDLTTSFTCYEMSDEVTAENFCADDNIEEVLTMVHTSVSDWVLTLANDDGQTVVIVEHS
jgi:hypothetical protein